MGGVEKNLNVKLCSYLTFAFVSTSPSQEVNQWRIQDFPEEGAPTLQGGRQHMILLCRSATVNIVSMVTQTQIMGFFLNVLHWIRWIQWQKIYDIKRTRTCHSPTSCVRDQHATTAPARHMWETGSLNWAQFMLQWFIRLPEFEFTEFSESSVPFRKNSIGSAPVLCVNVCISIYTILKDHSHDRQRLRVRLRLRQDDNIVAMRTLHQTQRMGVEPILCVWCNGLRNMLQFEANAHADANIDARVNGP